MTNFAYDNSVPATNNNPSDDQPDLLQNTQSAALIWDEDHIGFGQQNGGFHKQARILNQVAIPTGRIAGEGTIYSKLASSTTPLTESNLFFTPDISGNEYQLTRPVTASFTRFGTNLAYGSPPAGSSFVGGWTFLPGGLLMQYGIYSGTVSGNPGIPSSIPPILFPVKFDNPPINIQITQVADSAGTNNSSVIVSLKSGTISTTTFSVNVTNVPTNAYVGFSWVAIGR